MHITDSNVIAKEIIRLSKNKLPLYSPLVPAENGTSIQKNLFHHKPGLKMRACLIYHYFPLRALNQHNLAILARSIKLWPPFCLSWEADSKYICDQV